MPTKKAGPKGWKPAAGCMKKGARVLQVFKPQASNPNLKKIKGGMGAKIIRIGKTKLHTSDALKRGWKRITCSKH